PAPEAGALPGCATLRLDEARYIDGGTNPRKETRDLRCPWRAMLLGGHPLTISMSDCRRPRAKPPETGHITETGIGAWPSGKATGFGPVIPGSNPGAPAIVQPLMPTRLAAVVMAGGLGTRMRSALPKHLHQILGRRMVDWVLEA